VSLEGVRVGSRYLATEVVGQGSFGTVFRAEGPDGPVAVKLLRPDLAGNPDVVNRFLRERSVLLRLRHPRLVSVRDLVAESELLALVMDFVDGPDLRTYLSREGRLSPSAAALLVADVADALAHTHAAGVVHRDLKPENVLLHLTEGAPVPLLTDFGIARLAATGSTVTGPRTILGTPAYLAPEIAQGRPVAAPADVYACGILLYELMTGSPPFTGEHALAVVHRQVTETPTRPPEIPEPLWAIVAACLAKDPAQRPDAPTLAALLRGQQPPPPPLEGRTQALPGPPPPSPGAPHRTTVMPGSPVGPASGSPASGGPASSAPLSPGGMGGLRGQAVVAPRSAAPVVAEQEAGPSSALRRVTVREWVVLGLVVMVVAVLGIVAGYGLRAATAPAPKDQAAGAASHSPAPAPTATTLYVSDLPYTAVANGWGPVERNHAVGGQGVDDGGPITVGGQQYPHGLGVNSPSQVRVYPAGRCTSFTAILGLDQEVVAISQGTVDFQVLGDGRPLFDSGIVTWQTPAKPVQVDITNVQVLDLIVTDGGDGNGNDHADWADPKVTCKP
jgi:hypothetical protein